jgi:serine/threonine protein kinase
MAENNRPTPPTAPRTETMTVVDATTRLVPGAVVEGSASRYRIDIVAKAGGMGETYRATDLKDGRSVLVKLVQAKFLKSHGGGAAERIVRRFEREIAILRALKGETNVVALLDEGVAKDKDGGGSRFMVQEFIVGVELRRLLREGAPMALPQFAKLGAQLLQGIAAIHERGQSHRDIKPENIMVERRPDGTSLVKYIDFGLGRPVFGAIEQVTHMTDRLGPAAYVAPELSSRMGEIRDDEVRFADVYSVAALLWRMAVGNVPFPQGTTPAQRRDPPLPSGGVADALPKPLKEMIRRSLLPRPLDRPTAAEFRDAFVPFAAQSLRIGAVGAPVEAETSTPTEVEPDRLGRGMKLGGRYRIEDKLGEGSMGVVYRATDTTLKRVVAVKAAHDKRALVTDEAENLARVEHQNIVRVIDVGEDDGIRYIVMEYVGGRTLAEMLAAGEPLSGDLLRDFALGVVDGVRFAHNKGVLHNDLGPNNVKWDSEKRAARILDFGISVGGAKGAAKVEATNLAVLTPDQLRGVEGEASDIYQIGILLYLMSTGREPYVAEGSIEDYKRLVLEHLPTPPIKVLPALDPPELSDVVMKCLAKKPEDRFPSAEALYETLVEVFRPRATVSKAPAIVAAALACVLVVVLGLYFAEVGPFARKAAPNPTALFLAALDARPTFGVELRGRGAARAAIVDAEWLLSEPTERVELALLQEGAPGPAFWAEKTKDVPSAAFQSIVRVERRRLGVEAGGVETPSVVRTSDGVEIQAPADDGAYEDVLLVDRDGGVVELARVAFMRDVAPPTTRLVAIDGVPTVPYAVQAGLREHGLPIRGEARDGLRVVAPRVMIEPPDAAIFSGGAAPDSNGRFVDVKGRLQNLVAACSVRVACEDLAGRASVGPIDSKTSVVVLPPRVVGVATWNVDGAKRAVEGSRDEAEPTTIFAPPGTTPILEVEPLPRALPDGARLVVEAAEVSEDGSKGAFAPLRPMDADLRRYAAAEIRGRRRLTLRFFVEFPRETARLELRDRVRDVLFTTTAPRCTFATLDLRAGELEKGPADDGREIALAPGERLRVAGPEGMRLEATFEGDEDAGGRTTIASPSQSIAEVAARVGADGSPWTRRLRLKLHDPAAATPHESTLVVAVAPFGLKIATREDPQAAWRFDAGAEDAATCFIAEAGAWPATPIKVDDATAVPGAVVAFPKLERVSAGFQVADRAAARASTAPVARFAGREFQTTVRVVVGGVARDVSKLSFVKDGEPPVVSTLDASGAPIDLLPYDRASDYVVFLSCDDGAEGSGVAPTLRVVHSSGGMIETIDAEPATDAASRIRRFRLSASRLSVDGRRFVVVDAVGNETERRFAETARPSPVVPDAPKPPPPLTKAVVDARAAVVGIVLHPVPSDAPQFRMMEFELTAGDVRRLSAALSARRGEFEGVPDADRARVADVAGRQRGADDAPIDVSPSEADVIAGCMGLVVPTVAQWGLAARGDASSGFPRRAEQGEFMTLSENGANLGSRVLRPKSWFTAKGRHGLLSMAGNMAELAREGTADVWLGGDCETTEPPGRPVRRRPRYAGVRFLTLFR